MENIKKEDKLEFDKSFLESLLPKQLSYSELNDYITLTAKKNNKNIDSFVEVCSQIGFLDTYSEPLEFHKKTAQYKKKIASLEKMDNIEKKRINKETDNHKSIIKEINELNDYYKEDVKTAKYLYTQAIRNEHGDLLNDMECLLFNVNFDMLNYEQLYHLIIDPFKNYITNFYLDICFSVINGKEKDRLLFSNIIEFYEIMMNLELKYKNSLEGTRQEHKKNIEKRNRGHKKPIN